MASRGQHLDDVEGREIVFCHGCKHEWYRDDHPGSLACPQCRRDFTEIVTPEHDPRSDDGSAESDSDIHSYMRRQHRQHLHRHHHHDSDSDPEEGDIEEHLFRGPGRLSGHRIIHRSPETSPYSRMSRTHPGNSNDMFRRLTELMGDTGGRGMVGRSGPETLFHHDDFGGSRVTYQTFRGPGFTGGMSSFTITTGPGPRMAPSPAGQGPRADADPFMRIFGELINSVPPLPMRQADPSPRDPNSDNDGHDGAERPSDIATVLNQLLAVIVNPNIVHGDAVYSQEALDRIITNLMEANPQSNAPPPASENAIASLPKRKLDANILGPELKGECTICIEEVHVGDEVIMLPCGHWFHEECAGLWLKQHNSCPVCRAGIDSAAAGKPRNEATASQSTPPAPVPSSSSSSSSRPTAFPERGQTRPPHGEGGYNFIRSLATTYDAPSVRQQDSNAPPSNVSSTQSSRRSRCPSPPSRTSTNGERTRENRGSSSSGPLNWLRDRFSGR
ncbi:hypothetical protein F4861DRAFT_244557 [Xylaria intraflava]|nr:hypothetical protein F4861DRAFT_244557 [Xylaria intraflava]